MNCVSLPDRLPVDQDAVSLKPGCISRGLLSISRDLLELNELDY